MKNIIKTFLLAGMVVMTGVSITSCSLDPEQSNYKDNEKEPIRNVDDLLAGLNGSYARMTSALYYGRDIIIFSEARSPYMYSDNRSGRFGNISGFTITPGHAYAKETWEQIYKVISNTNRVIEADVADDAYVQYYKGQAYIIRALAHYDLLRLYGEQYVGKSGMTALGIPYKLSFRDIDEKITRKTVKENSESIFADLNLGIEMMRKSESEVKSQATQRARITLASAYGIKSRIALFFASFDSSKYDLVIESAELAITKAKERNISVMSRSGFLDAYKGDGIMSNSLFELTQFGTDNQYTNSLYNIYFKSPTEGYGDLVWNGGDKLSFFPESEEGMLIDDIRSDIVGKDAMPTKTLRNLGKYTTRTSNIRMMRIEELMLNYIEATIKGASKGKTNVALDYLNEIVSQRVTLQEGNNSPVAKKYTTLDFEAYKVERQRELMFEGFGYEDVMRWKGEVTNPRIKANMNISKDKVEFGDVLTAFPIPQVEINVSKIEQNQAYK
ncbi:RagB/SusD family nutrient uptake outer membrane protein [Myroides odoratimimus]|uniref:RagB/SusD family nutrient uptake outer membrane protein n=1 Tax=Myroides odoratimimus TaxID=76832 RepID=UPI000912EE4F|nr:RagB/SusD family nutrient uptake outer membrane protein [Myroides odoratimimus]SHL05394.1 SusD family protein [Myroides odoratimimus subsp. xuanwuensis]